MNTRAMVYVMTDQPTTKALSVRIPVDLLERVRAEGLAQDRSINYTFVRIIRDHFAAIDAAADRLP